MAKGNMSTDMPHPPVRFIPLSRAGCAEGLMEQRTEPKVLHLNLNAGLTQLRWKEGAGAGLAAGS